MCGLVVHIMHSSHLQKGVHAARDRLKVVSLVASRLEAEPIPR